MNLDPVSYASYNPLMEYSCINDLKSAKKFKNKLVTYFTTDHLSQFMESRESRHHIFFAMIETMSRIVTVFPLFKYPEQVSLFALDHEKFVTKAQEKLYLRKVESKYEQFRLHDHFTVETVLESLRQNPRLTFAAKTHGQSVRALEQLLERPIRKDVQKNFSGLSMDDFSKAQRFHHQIIEYYFDSPDAMWGGENKLGYLEVNDKTISIYPFGFDEEEPIIISKKDFEPNVIVLRYVRKNFQMHLLEDAKAQEQLVFGGKTHKESLAILTRAAQYKGDWW
jgi:hypothetical protein